MGEGLESHRDYRLWRYPHPKPLPRPGGGALRRTRYGCLSPLGVSIPGAMNPIGWIAAASCFSRAAICS